MMTLQRKNFCFAYGMLTPLLLITILVLIIPLVSAFRLSFFQYRLGQVDPMEYVGTANYLRILGDPRFLAAFARTVVFMAATVLLQMLGGFFVALLLAKPFPAKGLLIAAVLSPMAASEAVLAVIWRYLLNFQMGPVNYAIQLIGMERVQFLTSPEWALWSVVFVYSWQAFPSVFILLYPVRLSIPHELYEAAHIDGARALQTLRLITAPMMRAGILVALVFRTIISLRTFGIFQTLTRGGPGRATEVLSIFLYQRTFAYWQFGAGAAVGFIMVALTMVLASGQIRRMHKSLFGKEALR